MTQNPKVAQFICHEEHKEALKNLHRLYEAYSELHSMLRQGEWSELSPENLAFEHNTYDRNAEISFNFIDKNEHSHKITIAFYGDSISSTC